jgi:hypothetical protein
MIDQYVKHRRENVGLRALNLLRDCACDFIGVFDLIPWDFPDTVNMNVGTPGTENDQIADPFDPFIFTMLVGSLTRKR